MNNTGASWEGYTNKQTWSAVLWADNNYGMIKTMWETVRWEKNLPMAIKNYWKNMLSYEHYEHELGMEVPEWVYSARADLGDLNTIDWEEVAEGFMETARAEGLVK